MLARPRAFRGLFWLLLIFSAWAAPLTYAESRDIRELTLSSEPAAIHFTAGQQVCACRGTVILASGDLGWAGFVTDLADRLAAQGCDVVGLDTRADVTTATRRRGALGDLCRIGSLSFQDPQQNGKPQTTGKPETTDQPPNSQNPHHIFIFVPAFKVEYRQDVPPLTPHEKLIEFFESTYDPRGLGFAGAEALLLEHSNKDGFCGYGPGIGGYAKCYGAARLDANVSGFFGDFLFPVWMHQDTRYFRLGQRSVGVRVLYTLSRVFITRSDITRKPVFNSSALAGTVLAGTLSNLYYPQADRGVGFTMSRIAIDLAGTATFNLAAEFWQDIKTKVFRWKD